MLSQNACMVLKVMVAIVPSPSDCDFPRKLVGIKLTVTRHAILSVEQVFPGGIASAVL